METRHRALIRVTAVVLLTLALVYLAKLAGLSMDTYRAEEAENELAAEVTRMATSVEALETAVIEAESDAFVEDWARDEREWSREGDVVVEVDEVAGGPASTPEAPGAESSAWERLKGWIAGDDDG